MLLKFLSTDRRISPRRLDNANLRLSGGILADCVSKSVIARLVDDQWIHDDVAYSSLMFAGATRLLFGLPGHPWRLSQTIRSLSVQGSELLSDGARFAWYVENCEMWRASARPIWWYSMHILNGAAFGPEMETLPDLHLWALHPDLSHAGPSGNAGQQ